MIRHASVGLVVALTFWIPGVAEAGVQNIPCKSPFVFTTAAVNVVVLPYEAAQALPAAGLGDKLSALLQMEVLRSIAKFGSVGAVQMVGTTADCNPDLVIAKLVGRTPGAKATVGKGQGLIVVWGRFYRQGDDVFVQTFCRFFRAGLEETFDVSVGARRFSAPISSPAFACASWKVTVENLQNFEQQFRKSTILYPAPQESSSGSQLPSEPMPYWISDTQGDWMKITLQNGPTGWIRLSSTRDTWSIARWLPELKYIEGIAGYLRSRVAAQQSAAIRPEWIANANRAFAEYETSADELSKAGRGSSQRTALAGAVQTQLRGILAALRPNATVDDRAAALRLFERAEAMLPGDGNARNLRAVAQLSLVGAANSSVSLKQIANDLLQALGADPGNSGLLVSLEGAYELLLEAPKTGAVTLTSDERLEVGQRLAAIKEIRTARKR